jgi:hypothetical protein
METKYDPKIPEEPIPIALSFGNDGRITSVTTARAGATTVDAQGGCILGYWMEASKHEELISDAAKYRELHPDSTGSGEVS